MTKLISSYTGWISGPTRKIFWLGGIALALVGLCTLLAWRYPLGPSLVDPRASWVTQVAPTLPNAALHLAIYLGLTLLYLAALRLLRPSEQQTAHFRRGSVGIVAATWLACSAALMAAAPAGESHDIFDYLFRGRMMVEYGGNPLVDVPEKYGLTTPYTRFLAWRKNVDTYGPLWEAASAAVAGGVRQVTQGLGWWLDRPASCPWSPESCRLLISYISGYRLLAILLTGLSGCFVFERVQHDRPSFAPLALAAWLLSPMTLIATALGGHNDALMIVILLAGWWLLQRARLFWAILALILAAHVKLTALIWLPACAWWIIWRWGWVRAIKVGLASVVSGAALSWLLYAPFGGWQTLPPMLQERSAYLANSVWRILKYLLTDLWGWPAGNAHQLSIGLANGFFLAGALLIPLWLFNFRPKRWRSEPIPPEAGDRTLWRSLAAVSLWYLLAGSFWFQHWYLLWVLAPAAFLPDSRLTRTLLPWLAFGALSSNAAMSFLLATTLKDAPPIAGYVWVVAMIWGPMLLAAFISQIVRRRAMPDHLMQ
jgi:hypothetical protein